MLRFDHNVTIPVTILQIFVTILFKPRVLLLNLSNLTPPQTSLPPHTASIFPPHTNPLPKPKPPANRPRTAHRPQPRQTTTHQISTSIFPHQHNRPTDKAKPAHHNHNIMKNKKLQSNYRPTNIRLKNFFLF